MMGLTLLRTMYGPVALSDRFSKMILAWSDCNLLCATNKYPTIKLLQGESNIFHHTVTILFVIIDQL